MIQRKEYLQKAREILKERSVLAILGPRQCGKTTLARELMGSDSMGYIDLERPSDLAKIEDDSELYLKNFDHPLIIDEAQRLPELFSVLRSEVDRRKRKGQFILLGSSSFALIESLGESLSGRVGFLDLTPLGLFEASRAKGDWESHWLKGGFPEAFLGGVEDQLNFNWFEDYTRTLIERDLPSLGIQITPHHFRRLWAMCTHFHSNLLNMNKMANSLDLSPHTVKRYLDILEQTFMVRRLPPFLENSKKRLVKSPKFYVRDSGLYHYFQRILDRKELFESPERGASFEGYGIEQLLQVNRLKSPQYEPFFYRTSDQIEVDLLLVKGKKRVPIELKASLSPRVENCQSLVRFLKTAKVPKAYVFCLGDETYALNSQIQAIGINRWAQLGYPAFWDT